MERKKEMEKEREKQTTGNGSELHLEQLKWEPKRKEYKDKSSQVRSTATLYTREEEEAKEKKRWNNSGRAGGQWSKLFGNSCGACGCWSRWWTILIALIIFVLLVVLIVLVSLHAYQTAQSHETCIAPTPSPIQPNSTCTEAESHEAKNCEGDKKHGEDVGGRTKPFVPPPPKPEEFPWQSQRLPLSIKPLKYHLLLQPNLELKHLKGQVEVTVMAMEKTDLVVFHAKNLNLTSIAVLDANQEMETKELKIWEPWDQIALRLRTALEAGRNYSVKVVFERDIPEYPLEGIYMSYYTDPQGRRMQVISSHFEPTHARQAFPCWDEPSFKAVFSISIARTKGLQTLSNMPLLKTEDLGFYQPNIQRDDYAESVPMSTYLVAICVMDFSSRTVSTRRNVRVSTWAPSHLINQTMKTLQYAANILDFYEQYYHVRYPLPKLDLIGIPNFKAGAMENWGLITFRMNLFAASNASSSSYAQQSVLITVAHELAHQWFGNYVTMAWWDDLWLNEGFAAFMEYLGAGSQEPDWEIPLQFYSQNHLYAFSLDHMVSSHPVSVPVETPEEARALFDYISYQKEIMETWTKQQSYPLVSVRMSSETTDEGNVVILEARQTRFRTPTRDRKHASSSLESYPMSPIYQYKWHIPLSCFLYYPNGTLSIVKQWMHMNDSRLELSSAPLWVKCNVNATGFYRVKYSKDLRDALAHFLKDNVTVLPPLDRASVLSDAFAETTRGEGGTGKEIEATPEACDREEENHEGKSRSEMRSFCAQKAFHIKGLGQRRLADEPGSVATALEIMEDILRKEVTYEVWEAGIFHLLEIDRILMLNSAQTEFREFLDRIFRPALRKLDWNDSGSHVTKLLRDSVCHLAIQIDMAEALDRGHQLFNAWRNGAEMAPNLLSCVYKAGIKRGNEEEFNFLWDKYQLETDPQEKVNFIKALASSRTSSRLQRLLDWSMNATLVARQDLSTVFGVMCGHPLGHFMAWRHLRLNWDWYSKEIGGDTLGRILYYIISVFNTKFDVLEAKLFFRGKDLGEGYRRYEHALEKANLHIWWLKTHVANLISWLNSRRSHSAGDPHPHRPIRSFRAGDVTPRAMEWAEVLMRAGVVAAVHLCTSSRSCLSLRVPPTIIRRVSSVRKPHSWVHYRDVTTGNSEGIGVEERKRLGLDPGPDPDLDPRPGGPPSRSPYVSPRVHVEGKKRERSQDEVMSFLCWSCLCKRCGKVPFIGPSIIAPSRLIEYRPVKDGLIEKEVFAAGRRFRGIEIRSPCRRDESGRSSQAASGVGVRDGVKAEAIDFPATAA
ncbi:unnamed protein product [Darwinula stevensoni]|uniref:Aminopeptidase n=1 Tax=Darwinula stevensoni TaxID=69355 RepID=A0A7R8XA74_9CRUS|nr:unnamed protein product [Darwinula stevensoni]CAG0889728.1 unnamed protein product [Darwinula stevensoni]